MALRYDHSQFADPNPPLRPKREQSAELARAVDEYLSRGGKIEQVECGVTGETWWGIQPTISGEPMKSESVRRKVKLGARRSNNGSSRLRDRTWKLRGN